MLQSRYDTVVSRNFWIEMFREQNYLLVTLKQIIYNYIYLDKEWRKLKWYKI